MWDEYLVGFSRPTFSAEYSSSFRLRLITQYPTYVYILFLFVGKYSSTNKNRIYMCYAQSVKLPISRNRQAYCPVREMGTVSAHFANWPISFADFVKWASKSLPISRSGQMLWTKFIFSYMLVAKWLVRLPLKTYINLSVCLAGRVHFLMLGKPKRQSQYVIGCHWEQTC